MSSHGTHGSMGPMAHGLLGPWPLRPWATGSMDPDGPDGRAGPWGGRDGGRDGRDRRDGRAGQAGGRDTHATFLDERRRSTPHSFHKSHRQPAAYRESIECYSPTLAMFLYGSVC